MRSTACTSLEHEHVEQRTRVKCIVDRDSHAIYFSRGVLPANKDGLVRPFPAPFQQQNYLLHLGLACFDREFLAEYCRMPPTPLMVRCTARPLPQSGSAMQHGLRRLRFLHSRHDVISL